MNERGEVKVGQWNKKTAQILTNLGGFWWSGTVESNPPPQLGRLIG